MTTKRYGARYGKRVKDRLRAVETLSKRSYKCPYCHMPKVRRIGLGIFSCSKCKKKFTGKAYTLAKLKRDFTESGESQQEKPQENTETDKETKNG